jgi:hypothetical protein
MFVRSIAVFALAVGACRQAPDDVWMLTFSDNTVAENVRTCSETITLATCPVPPDQPDPWTTTVTQERSDAAVFGQILDGPKGEKVLVLNGQVLVGLREKGEWRFAWDNAENTERVENHTSGYRYVSRRNRTVSTFITLDLSGDTGTGTRELFENELQSDEESDQWDRAETGLSGGRIFSRAAIELEGEQFNAPDAQDCEGGQCKISLETTRRLRSTVQARRIPMDPDGFEGVMGAGQTAGAGGNGSDSGDTGTGDTGGDTGWDTGWND